MKTKHLTRIRHLNPSDIPAIMDIQSACYPAELLEDAAHLLAKHQQSPASCWVATIQEEVSAYLLTHPWSGDTPPDLNAPLPPASTHCNIHFIHDLAVHPKAQGAGLARLLMDSALSWSQQHPFTHLRLIAVAGAKHFWLKQGFTLIEPLNNKIINKLNRYGPDTHYLEANLYSTHKISP
ncbi:GNAT family N-acetyltransferase [Iodobacter arcticus]|uniref:GNAT family N-acetyltransferase n=1 Tax=Iodobacter arcticus TaxID=590593 RepID=A0ABW2R193_9NEIS